VETAQQLEFLSAEDCGQVQGFYFGRPASADQIRATLASGYAEAQLFSEQPPISEETTGKVTPITAAKGKRRSGTSAA
jgi:hypothetical protein